MAVAKIIKFGAEWCGPCRMLDSVLADYTDVPVEVHNIDETPEEVVKKYGIRSVPTMIFVDENNEVVEKKVGAMSLIQIKEVVTKHNGQ